MVRRFIEAWEGNERIALIASGCFAMDVGGPLRGWIDTEWAETISKLLVAASIKTWRAALPKSASTPPATTAASF